MELDHVLIAVTDLGSAARELEARYGLISVEGGRHPGWGTANRIVPLGDAYIELVTVVDEAEAERSAFGSWVAGALPALARPLGWAVRTTIDDVAERLGLTVDTGSRAVDGGPSLRWRLAGVEHAAAEPALPFFIEWGDGTPLPGRAAVTHREMPMTFASVQLAGDADRLSAWLGSHDLPLIVRPGTAALTSITLAGALGEIVLADLR